MVINAHYEALSFLLNTRTGIHKYHEGDNIFLQLLSATMVNPSLTVVQPVQRLWSCTWMQSNQQRWLPIPWVKYRFVEKS